MKFKKEIPTSFNDIKKLTRKYDMILNENKRIPPIKFMNYDMIKQIDNLSKFMERHPRILIFYKTSPNNMGHWNAIIKNKNNIYFFDSYGFFIEDILKDIDINVNENYNQDFFYLSKLIYKEMINGLTIFYNHKKLQGQPPIATCGLWCAYIFGFYDCNIDKLINKLPKKNKDDFIVETSNMIF